MNNWQVLSTYIYPHDAHMAKGFLESESIEVIVKDELTAQVNNFYSNAIGGVKLLVRSEDYEIGIDTLIKGGYINAKDQANVAKIEVVPITENLNKSICPYCKSDNIGRKSDPNILAVILYFILGVLYPIFRRSYICFDCSKEWKYEKQKLLKTTHNNV